MRSPTPWWHTLQQGIGFPHPVSNCTLIETHISRVLLTGEYAYKFKKPVKLGFLDFSTLALRRHFCEEELRLNARLAPGLYLDMVVVTGTPEAPRIARLHGHPAAAASSPLVTPATHDPIIDYGIRMRQFDQATQFDRLLARDALTPQHIDRLAARIAHFHQDIAQSDSDDTGDGHSHHYGSPEAVAHPVDENVTQLRTVATAHPELHDALPLLDTLAQWSRDTHAQHCAQLIERQHTGFIRECHGDLHLRNIALYEGEIAIFDGIEFSAALRWIDIISDVAFLVMDLFDHARPALAWRLLNAWLSHTGDYAGLALLPYYLVYRAMVRAKVAAIRLTQAAPNSTEHTTALAECRDYLTLATRFTRPARTWLCLTHGVSGSGKTHYSQYLLEAFGAIRLRSDVERKRLYGLSPRDRPDGPSDNAELYGAAATQATYTRLAQLTGTILEAGYPVIVDATFLQRTRRQVFTALAHARHIPGLIITFTAAEAVLRERIVARQMQNRDASDAGLDVLAQQLSGDDPVDVSELELGSGGQAGQDREHASSAVLCIDTGKTDALDTLLGAVRKRLEGAPRGSAVG